jgi:hypothetical protein
VGRPSAGTVIAVLALCVAVGGGSAFAVSELGGNDQSLHVASSGKKKSYVSLHAGETKRVLAQGPIVIKAACRNGADPFPFHRVTVSASVRKGTAWVSGHDGEIAPGESVDLYTLAVRNVESAYTVGGESPDPQPTSIVASNGDTLNMPPPGLGGNIFNHHCVVSAYAVG